VRQDVARLYGVLNNTPDANRQLSMFSNCSDLIVLVIQQLLCYFYVARWQQVLSNVLQHLYGALNNSVGMCHTSSVSILQNAFLIDCDE
jgi:hypothetical protein